MKLLEKPYTDTEYLKTDFNGGFMSYNINKFTDILTIIGFKYFGGDIYVLYNQYKDQFIIYNNTAKTYIICKSDKDVNPHELYFVLTGESDYTWEEFAKQNNIKETYANSLEELF